MPIDHQQQERCLTCHRNCRESFACRVLLRLAEDCHPIRRDYHAVDHAVAFVAGQEVTQKRNDSGSEQLEQLEKADLIDLILQQADRIEELSAQVQHLEDQLARNSRNSSKPPSSDGLKTPRRTSRRKKGERKAGGQKGHPGNTLERVTNPDHVQEHQVHQCEQCQTDLRDVEAERVVKRRVFDLPPVQLEVTEHQAEDKVCPGCGAAVEGDCPPHVSQKDSL